MAPVSYPGEVVAKLIEIKFAISGKVVKVNKFIGDAVKAGELLASLDKKQAQTELDKELANFEKKRADFEVWNLHNSGSDQITQYLKKGQQSDLDNSVKNVELATVKVGQTDLFSPLTGIVVDDGGMANGIYLTPSSNYFTVMDTSKIAARIEVAQKDLDQFTRDRTAVFRPTGWPKKYSGACSSPVPTQVTKTTPVKFFIDIRLLEAGDLLPRMAGEVELTS